ncbi:MAG: cytochrome c [Halofilum sp. (in: g-proteobacteria)]|nr:cytochrome c [Halofilum sp. (in: g-proteobacteria)]
MRSRRVLALAAAALGASLATAAQAEGDVEAGRYKSQTCLGCHGIADYGNVYPSYHVPKLGGQHAEYIVSALQAYKQGQRQHPTMKAQAASLSMQDMQDIAAYFATVDEPR